ncbi:cytochrome P450 [Favolaschia claudopus]|uniref:Cytochrome P450 n=1 Tax=Favolaschia claudopus TaxID=2862362 RepID=A0AAV9ZPV8_9AGAR
MDSHLENGKRGSENMRDILTKTRMRSRGSEINLKIEAKYCTLTSESIPGLKFLCFTAKSRYFTDIIRRIHRRLFTEGLNDISEFHAAARTSVRSLLRMAGEMMLSVAYGMDPDSHHIALAEEATKAFLDVMVPGKYLVVSGTAQPCFTVNTLQELDQGKNYYDMKNVAAIMHLAGADIIASTLSIFMFAMLVNPDAQKKAQHELDSVLGVGNLPDFFDEEALPYTAAVVKEVLRWKNTAPFGISSPGGINCLRKYLMDYPDPFAFLPERFLLDGKHNPAVRDPHQCAFGFGRRWQPHPFKPPERKRVGSVERR